MNYQWLKILMTECEYVCDKCKARLAELAGRDVKVKNIVECANKTEPSTTKVVKNVKAASDSDDDVPTERRVCYHVP